MPIKWSALKVREATDEAEKFIEQMKEPVASVKAIAEKALEIPNLPGYMEQGFNSLSSEAEKILGGVYSWNKEPYQGNFDRIIQRIRDDIPSGAVAQDQASRKYGSTQSLV